MTTHDEILAFYARGDERGRLTQPPGALEALRTREELEPLLPPPPARIADVGGGPGEHARWLASLGHDVELIDASDLHVAQAQALAERTQQASRMRARVGDARALDLPDASMDAVLLLGPLYHLIDRDDRIRSLREARRVARSGGLVAASAISRGACLLDGLRSGALGDPAYPAMALQDLSTGQHRCPDGKPWFTTAYFHEPDGLRDEAREAGLEGEIVGLEGIGVYLPDLAERWLDAVRREQVLFAARAISRHPSLRALSPHLLLLARVP